MEEAPTGSRESGVPEGVTDAVSGGTVCGADRAGPGQRRMFMGRRTAPGKLSGSLRSLDPRPIVIRAISVARDAAAIPRCPAVFASAAANRRRERSSGPRPTTESRSRIVNVSAMRRVYPRVRARESPPPRTSGQQSSGESFIGGGALDGRHVIPITRPDGLDLTSG